MRSAGRCRAGPRKSRARGMVGCPGACRFGFGEEDRLEWAYRLLREGITVCDTDSVVCNCVWKCEIVYEVVSAKSVGVLVGGFSYSVGVIFPDLNRVMLIMD